MTGAAPGSFRAGLVQLRSGRSVGSNIDAAEALIRRAAAAGADYVQTPENTSLMEMDGERLFAAIEAEENSTPLARLKALASELGIWLHIGSLGIKLDGAKIANRSYLIAPDGGIVARYDKLHLFDVDLAGGESYRESKSYAPGSKAVVADLPWGRLGLSICYDLRIRCALSRARDRRRRLHRRAGCIHQADRRSPLARAAQGPRYRDRRLHLRRGSRRRA